VIKFAEEPKRQQPPISMDGPVNFARRASLIVRVVAATAWAGVMVLSGLWIVFILPEQLPRVNPTLSAAAGLAIAAGGQFVFMILVADRVYPRASRRITGVAEAAAFIAFAAGLGLAVWALTSGALR
jgi:hypothetical protein